MAEDPGHLRSRRAPGYSRPYVCPACGVAPLKERQVWYGPFVGHADCRIVCGICEGEIPKPVLGKPRPGAVWCGLPVHAACKEAQA